MDASGNIYQLTDEQRQYIESKDSTRLKEMKIAQDVGRLDGFLKGSTVGTARRHERLIHDSRPRGGKPGTYRKEKKMGVEGIEELGSSASDQSDPGDEQTVGQPAHIRENMAENVSGREDESGEGPGSPPHAIGDSVPEPVSEADLTTPEPLERGETAGDPTHPPSTDAQPGTPGDGGHEVTPGSPSIDDPTQPDATNEPEATGTN